MFLTILVDVVIALVIIIGALVGMKRGFFITVTKPIKWFFALLLAVTLCNPVADHVIMPMVEEPFTVQLTEYLEEKCDGVTAENASEELPTLLKIAAGAFDVDIETIDEGGTKDFLGAVVEKLAMPAIHIVAVILAFILTYIVSKLLLSITIRILNYVFEFGIFDVFNKILGFVFGGAFAFVGAWLLVVIFGYVISVPSIAETELISSFDGGIIYDFFKKMSPFDLLLSF